MNKGKKKAEGKYKAGRKCSRCKKTTTHITYNFGETLLEVPKPDTLYPTGIQCDCGWFDSNEELDSIERLNSDE